MKAVAKIDRQALLFLIPLAILLGTGFYIHLHWTGIPARFPDHWNADGSPDGWSNKTFLGVYGGVLLGVGVVLVTLGMYAFLSWAHRRGIRNSAGRTFPVAPTYIPLTIAYLIAFVASTSGLSAMRVPKGGISGILASNIGSLIFLAVVVGFSIRRGIRESGGVRPFLCGVEGEKATSLQNH